MTAMLVRGSRVALFAPAVLVAACLPAPLQGQVQLVIEGEGAIEVRGDAVVVQGVAQPFGGESLGGIDPWWGDDAAAVPPAAEGQADGRQQAQVRLAQARRARAQTVLVRELSRVREACPGLEPAQRAAVLAAGRRMVEDQAAGHAPLANGIEPVLERALEQAAGPDVAVVAVMVEAVDRDALLDDRERTAVAGALAERWRPEWQSVAATALRQRITFARLPPGVPDAVAAVLDPETAAAWRARAVEAPR